ncbi:hypothetical protein [Shewanella sp. Isolate11]|uniref:hypothetical protein n=1 Tax=Shewanella sp. Isolate11 TaxID=2908530 RepID=UPI001EFD5E96|nr:hypothetical protein [Shewanella sp. Isolate11]MCG9697639.1 hypothetical protein [Shewanella sp. Isolate11]
MKRLLVTISCLFVGQAYAQCSQPVTPVDIPFEVNSSYFASQYAQQLQQFIQQTESDSGYLLIEFPLFKGDKDAKMQEYDLWLANRRIERVKTYLTKSEVQSPIVTRLLTAGKEDSRTVSLHWCQQEQDYAAIADNSTQARSFE